MTSVSVKVSQYWYCFNSMPHGVEDCFSGLCGKDISDAIFFINAGAL